MPFQIPITGRLVDPLGSGISGAQVWFTSKATTRGPENVAKTVDGYFATDASGYYSTSLASGWYKIDLLEPGALDVERLGVATVSGTETLDLGTLIDNSIPPPSLLQNISNVQSSGLANRYVLAYNTARGKWVPTDISGALASQISASAAGVGTLNGLSGALSVIGVGSVSVTTSGSATLVISGSAAGGGNGDAEATGALLDGKINSLSGWASSAAALQSTGQQAWSTANNNGINLSGQLTATGATLNLRIDSLSGWAASAANLGATGSILDNRINSLSGYSTATYATQTALASTGSQAWNAARNNGINLSGQLTDTGSALFARDLAISGALVAQISSAAAGVSTLNGLSGILNLATAGTGVGISTSGNTIFISGQNAGGSTPYDMFSPLTSAEIGITGSTTAVLGRMHVCSGVLSDYTVALPTTSGNASKFIGFRMAPTLGRRVTLDAFGSETIDGADSRTMWANETAIIYSDGTSWTKVAGKTIPFYVEVNYPLSAFGNSGMSLAGSSFTKATPNTTVSDAANLWDTGNYWITIPRPGRYQFDSNFRLQDNFALRSYGMGVHTGLADGPWFTWNTSETAGVTNRNGAYNRRTVNLNVSGDRYFMYYYIDGTNDSKTAQVQLIMQEAPIW